LASLLQSQSPLHRGRISDFTRTSLSRTTFRCLSPLFIGALPLTALGFPFNEWITQLRSPLHRGWFFNLADWEGKTLKTQLRSPLHRGTSSNECKETPRKGCDRIFGPLFIGELPLTWRFGDDKYNRMLLRSPLHRGTLKSSLQRSAFSCQRTQTPTRRKSTSNDSMAQSLSGSIRVASPLHRGCLFNNGSATVHGFLATFRSPLHRGCLFNLENSTCAIEFSAFQSPLHRGTLLNTIENVAVSNCWEFQSPLHRGTLKSSLQPSALSEHKYPPVARVLEMIQ